MPTTRTLPPEAPWTGLRTTRTDRDRAEPVLLGTMLTGLRLVRAFEETVLELASVELVHGSAHSSIGQDGGAVGSMPALTEADQVNGSHRGHHRFLAKAQRLNTPLACDDPVLEHVDLYGTTGPAPADDLDYVIPPDRAKVVRRGGAVTGLARPSVVDWETTGASIRETNAVPVVEQGALGTASGTLLGDEIQRRTLDRLDQPVERVIGISPASATPRSRRGPAAAARPATSVRHRHEPRPPRPRRRRPGHPVQPALLARPHGAGP